MSEQSFQDQASGNHCWGCSPSNDAGLKIRSFWSGDEAVCTWRPSAHHAAAPTRVLNGGIIATIIDCHCIWTAIAAAHKAEGRPIGDDPQIWYATVALNISYRKATPIDELVTLRARVEEMTDRKTNLSCTLISGGEECVTAEMVAVRVPPEWMEGVQRS